MKSLKFFMFVKEQTLNGNIVISNLHKYIY